MNFTALVLEALILASALSIDAFVASFAYGGKSIKIPIQSILVISVICSTVIGISLLIGTIVRGFIPDSVTKIICFLLLFFLGLSQLLDSFTKSIIRKYGYIRGNFNFSIFNFRFVLSLYADPETADIDESKVISPVEASSLALALSLDGMGVGFGAALGNVNGLAVFICSLVTNFCAVLLGSKIGNKMAKNLPFNMSWISGSILIIMAVLKVI